MTLRVALLDVAPPPQESATVHQYSPRWAVDRGPRDRVLRAVYREDWTTDGGKGTNDVVFHVMERVPRPTAVHATTAVLLNVPVTLVGDSVMSGGGTVNVHRGVG